MEVGRGRTEKKANLEDEVKEEFSWEREDEKRYAGMKEKMRDEAPEKTTLPSPILLLPAFVRRTAFPPPNHPPIT